MRRAEKDQCSGAYQLCVFTSVFFAKGVYVCSLACLTRFVCIPDVDRLASVTVLTCSEQKIDGVCRCS